MFHVILYEPEIPPNTGNVIRLCANTGVMLHLVEPLGFEVDDARLKRAGLDYRDLAAVRRHRDWPACRASLGTARVFALSTHAHRPYSEPRFAPGDAFLFGPESRGLPEAVRTDPTLADALTIPMQPDSRSLNLSNAVAVVVYEAWRQNRFARGAAD